MEKKSRIQKMAVCSLFTALTAVGVFIRIPVPVVPFTLQFLFTMLAGLLLGGRLGAVSVGAYAILGLAGLPIFAEGGGFWYVLKPSFGYILGFILAAYVTGRMTEKLAGLTLGRILAANFVGLAIVYGAGMVYYYIICNYVINTPIGLWPLLFAGGAGGYLSVFCGGGVDEAYQTGDRQNVRMERCKEGGQSG